MALTWKADLTQADVVAAKYQDDNFNRQTNAGDGDASGLPWPMPIAVAPDGVRSTQAYLPSGGKRNEVVPDVPEFAPGDNFYFSQQFYLPAGFDLQATAGSGFQVIEQMRQDDDTGSPVVAFEVRNGCLLLSGGYGVLGASPDNQYQYQLTLAAGLSTDHRYTLIYRLGPYSTTPGQTTIDVWLDGTQALANYTILPATIIGGGTYRKHGLYRDPANTTAETVWQSGQAQGDTFADVAAVTATSAPPPVATPVPGDPSTTVSPIVDGRVYPSSFAMPLLLESHAIASRVLLLGDDGATSTELPLIDGSVSATSGATIRRTATMDVIAAWSDDPNSRLTPFGSRCTVERGIRIGTNHIEWVTLMTGRIVSAEQNSDNIGDVITLGLADEFFTLAADRFDAATPTDTTERVVHAITRLIQETLPNATVYDLTGDTTLCGAMDLAQDRAGGIDKLATSIGAECYTGRDWQTFIIRPTPTLNDPARWSVNVGPGGNLIQVDRTRTVDGTVYNRVLAMGETNTASSSTTVPPPYGDAVITDQTNPLWYGGPFGRVTRFYKSPLLTTDAQCTNAAAAILARIMGKSYVFDFESLVNPALDPGDVIQSTIYDGIVRTHIVDTASFPLSPTDAQSISTRSVELPAEDSTTS